MLSSAARRVRNRWPDLDGRAEENPLAVVREFKKRYERDHWEGATVAFALRAAKALFVSLSAARHRSSIDQRVFDVLRNFCVKETEISTQTSFLAGMMSIYLVGYVPESKWSVRLGNALDQARDRLARGTKWATLISRFPRILDARHAHSDIASQMLTMMDPWRGMKDRGYSSPHAPGLMEHAHSEYVRELRRRRKLRTRDGVEQLLRWLRPEGRERGRATGVPEALEAMLEPWRRADPPAPLKELLVERLVTCFGDPRTRAESWSTVGDDCKSVIYRWLAGEDIRFFLCVVSEANTSHMWEYRRKFWLGLYREGIVDAAWAAFSPQAQLALEQSRALDPRGRNIAFGRQSGRRSSNTSLLILKIGRCVVVEGSHSYKVHVFNQRQRWAPKLFQDSYDCESIRYLGDRPGVDAIPHNSGWQNKVREAIERCR